MWHSLCSYSTCPCCIDWGGRRRSEHLNEADIHSPYITSPWIRSPYLLCEKGARRAVRNRERLGEFDSTPPRSLTDSGCLERDLPGWDTVSQNVFSEMPKKLWALHQYWPASFSDTLYRVSVSWASFTLLTKLCRETHILSQRRARSHMNTHLMISNDQAACCSTSLRYRYTSLNSYVTCYFSTKTCILFTNHPLSSLNWF